MRILVLKFRNIGDVLLITPLITNLRYHYPEAEIDVSVNGGTESMLSSHPAINRVTVYDRQRIKSLSLFKRVWHEIGFITYFFTRKYDLVINLTEGDRGTYISILTRAPVRIGYPKTKPIFTNAYTHHLPEQGFRHTVETNLDPIRVLGLSVQTKRVNMYWDASDANNILQYLPFGQRDFVHVHPVSKWLFKCISDDTMALLIEFCEKEIGLGVVITSGPAQAEMAKVRGILAKCQAHPINLSGKLTLKQTAALNKRARCFIGVDTAIMHISAANDVPVLSFFGPSGADHWGPWDNNVENSGYTQRNGYQFMGRHRVYAEQRNCQPCGRDGCDGSKVSDCLMNMNIDLLKGLIVEIARN